MTATDIDTDDYPDTEDLLKEYFEMMVGRTIEAVGVFDDDLLIVLDDGSEVVVWSDDGNLAMCVEERKRLNS
jgi:hypothetical protein